MHAVSDFPEALTTQEVSRLTGVNRRTLRYWDATGFLGPSVRAETIAGTRRGYSRDDVVAVRVTRQLRQQGISLQALRQVIRILSRRKHRAHPFAETSLMTDGRDVYEKNACSVLSLLRQPGQKSFLADAPGDDDEPFMDVDR